MNLFKNAKTTRSLYPYLSRQKRSDTPPLALSFLLAPLGLVLTIVPFASFASLATRRIRSSKLEIFSPAGLISRGGAPMYGHMGNGCDARSSFADQGFTGDQQWSISHATPPSRNSSSCSA